jgi:hypothetical protein
MTHVRLFVFLFGSFKYCVWGGNVNADASQAIAAAGAIIASHGVPIVVEETPAV